MLFNYIKEYKSYRFFSIWGNQQIPFLIHVTRDTDAFVTCDVTH